MKIWDKQRKRHRITDRPRWVLNTAKPTSDHSDGDIELQREERYILKKVKVHLAAVLLTTTVFVQQYI